MLHKLPVFTRILCAAVALVCFLGGAIPTAVLTDAAHEGGAERWSLALSRPDAAELAPSEPLEPPEPSEPSDSMAPAADPAAFILTLTLSGSLPPDADPSAPAAVRITVDASENIRILSAERGGEVGENDTPPPTLTVTVHGCRAVILADGALKSLAELTVFITVEGEFGSDGGLLVAACPEGVAFYNHAREGVDCIAVTEARTIIGGDGGAGQGTEAPPDGESETVRPPTPAEEKTSVLLIGCQETLCASDVFSVRFIYQIADGGGIPTDAGVVCLAGRGVITVELSVVHAVTTWLDGKAIVTAADEGASYLLVTFRGLTARGEWVFRAACGNGKSGLVRWKNGQFLGWERG